MNVKTFDIRLSLALIFAIVAAGCETAPPTIQTGPEAELSFDGLHKVDNSQADVAWARPDFDISGYTKIMPLSGGIEYRQVKDRGRSSIARSQGGPYFINDEARARFEELVSEVFREELQMIERFEIVDEPGPDVLVVLGGLLDVVSYVPPDPVGGRSYVFLSSVGDATLVLELRDSETGTILARSVDRRAAEAIGSTLQDSNRVTNSAEVRRLIRHWASRLREGLDGFSR
jgi:hypothetical protein